jgi:hypothetical protein
MRQFLIIASYYAQCLIIALIIAPRAIMDLAPIIAKSIIALIIRIIALIIVPRYYTSYYLTSERT